MLPSAVRPWMPTTENSTDKFPSPKAVLLFMDCHYGVVAHYPLSLLSRGSFDDDCLLLALLRQGYHVCFGSKFLRA
jgi:hypothetical protein